MDIKVHPRHLGGELKVIASKSLSHRYVIAAGLAKGESVIENILDSKDLEATKGALENLNVRFDKDHIFGGHLSVRHSEIECNESGSTVRFMIPIAALLDEPITFLGKGRLPQRPLDIYEKLFKVHQVSYERSGEDHLPVTVKGKLKGGHFLIPGDVSSQFITGLLFALPLCTNDSVIEIQGDLESKGYVDLTLEVLKAFGIDITKEHQFFYIKGGQSYKPVKASIEGDFSQAAFFIVAGLLGDHIVLNGLNSVSKQGDIKIIELIRQAGGSIEFIENQLHIKKSDITGQVIDLSQIPDLGPILMILAGVSHGQTTFINAKRLRLKESDRLEVMYNLLKQLNVPVELKGNQLKVTGVKQFKGNQIFETYGDHRIAMALMIASIKVDAPIIVKNIEVIDKSYPTFLEDFKALGGYYETLN